MLYGNMQFYLACTFFLFLINGYSKVYGRHYELNFGFLREGLSGPEFYGDLLYRFKKLIGRNDFSFQFRKLMILYKRIGYNFNVMRHA